MSETAPSMKKFSFFFLAIVFITLALSIAAFFQAYDAYMLGEIENVYFFVLIGVSGLALSTYMVFQTRRRALKLAFRPPRIATTILCQKCGFKNIRDFERGDFIFKETEECPKCKEKTKITSIFREVKEKKKRWG
ncbi:hypothetical protein KAW11_04045 [Candidatus Bathyarchaeota archaeon]|nr:hypothetical protein [Candidatus Bathyarchaeota archaeon]